MKKGFTLLFILSLLFFTEQVKGQCLSTFIYNQNQCLGDSVQFTFTGTASNVEWNFGDVLSGPKNADTNRIVNHEFTDTGTYSVRCIAISGACRDTLTQLVYITEMAKARFSYSDACLGLNAQFTNLSTHSYRDSITQIAWDFGDTTGSMLFNPSHSYSSSGNKTICMTIVSSLGCRDTIKKNIKVIDQFSYAASKDSVCLGSDVDFSSNSGTEIPLSYLWSFGDGNISNVASPYYTYGSSGAKFFALTLIFSDSSYCTLNYDSIIVLDLPNATFSYLSDTVQCFKGNQVCIKFDSLNQNILFRNILWDDGSTSNVPIGDSVFCHSYANSIGSTYKVTMEVIDDRGCATRLKDSTDVLILREPIANFDFVRTGGCFKSFLDLNNLSNMQPPEVQSFKWQFGDGTSDTVNWLSPSHTYTANGNFNVTLQIRDTFGCSDTFTSNSAISNISYVVDARIDTIIDYCRLNNRFGFRQTPISGANITWYFGNGDSSTNFATSEHYNNIGDYFPVVRISKQGCDSILVLDTATVYGPYAQAQIQNRFQCQIQDTVYFNNVTATFRNNHIKTLWQLNDFVAANCTTDTKNGVNLNSNCNYSVDSLNFKHWFTPGNERCYTGFLVQTDTTVGCSDSFPLSIPLMRPNADSGLRVFYQNQPCVGPEVPKAVFINLNQTQPNCGRQRYYIMWDSLCAEESGNFNSHWRLNEDRHNYGYNNLPCDSNGYVTMGLIIENGLDSMGNVCRDTGFYHHIIRFGLLNPTIATSYNPDSLYCNYSTHDFFVGDSMQDSIVQIIWNFGDGTIDTVQTLGKVSHTYTQSGIYQVRNYVQHINGCDGVDTFQVRIGVRHRIDLPASYACLGDSVLLGNNSNYWLDPNPNYFRDDTRAAQGKERTRWDIGDGNGFQDSGSNIYLNYNRIGDYTIRMELRDSLGCLDTANLDNPFRVFDVTSQIQLPSDTLVCPQVMQLFSASTVYDSLNNFGHLDDSVSLFIWTFDDGSGSSLQANPSKFFDKGTQGIKLYAENTRGCRDSIVDSFFIVSPFARFTPVTDTMGCQPHLTTFRNQSVNANSFTWLFRNPSNNILNTTSQGDVNFNYTNYGTFYPELISRKNALNNGIPITCADTFPLLANNDTAIAITVFEKPIVRFSHTTDCSTNTTTYTNTTVINTDTILALWWTFGDGDSSFLQNPIHQYADTGAYRVVLHIRVGKGCEDSLVRTVYISPIPLANFNSTDICIEEQMQFYDATNAYNDVIYLWNWDFGDGTSSFIQNPLHLYTYDTAYRVRLRVTNRAGCFDTITKTVNVNSKPVVDYVFSNACQTKKNAFYGSATVKKGSLSYHWDFGDGGTSPSKNPQYVYGDTGNYQAKFTATSLYGCKDSIRKTVRVYPNPVTDFSINNPVQCLAQNSFTFINNSTIAIDTILYNYWYASDGGSGFNQDYNRVFANFDSIEIVLISLTDKNCTDTAIKWVEVLESPVSSPVISDLSVCVNGDSIHLADTFVSQETLTNRTWLHNGVNIGSDSAFKYKFNTVGPTDIWLIKELSNGCKDTSISNVIIYPKPNAYIKIPVDQQCLNGNAFQFSDSSWISDGTALSSKWYLGNGDSSILANFISSYAQADTFDVSLIVLSNKDCRDTMVRSVIVHPEPVADFSVDTSTQCLRGNQFQFTNQSVVAGTGMTYQWDFNAELSSVLVDPLHQFGSHGVKSVKLITASFFGCKDSITKNVEVYPMPLSRPTVNNLNQCLNDQNYIFTDSSSIAYGFLSRLWVWDNATTDTSKSLSRQFAKDTFYRHQLISSSVYGCADTAWLVHQVYPVPNALFEINDSGQCVNNQNFQFNNLSNAKDGIAATYWDYGDGNLDTLIQGGHFYPQAGIYTVRLIANSSQSCKDTHNIQLEVYHKPLALLSVNDSAQCFKDQNFSFIGNSSIPTGSLIRFEWDTFNTPFSGSKDTSLLFPVAGNYTLRYVVESNQNCLDTTFQDIVVHPDPSSQFTISDSIQCENDNLFLFNSTSSLVYGTMTDSWYADQVYWSDLMNPIRNFTSQDTVQVSLVNTTNKGCRDTAIQPIFIVPAPHAQFAINDSGQCLRDNQFVFANTSWIEDGVLSAEWDFGNGNSSSLYSPTEVYPDHGDYVVRHISTSIYGCKDTWNVDVLVHPEPMASFVVNNPSQCLNGNLFTYTNNSSIDSTQMSYQWFFGDGNSSQQTDPSHTHSNYGSFETVLYATSNYGCIDSAKEMLVVNPMPISAFSINDSAQCVNTQNFVFTNNSSIPTGNIINYTWHSRGVTAINVNPWQLGYPNSGPYGVLLESRSDSGCVDSAYKLIRVFPKPISGITVNDSVQCLRGNYYLFSERSFDSFGISGYSWRENNDEVSTADTFGRTYLNAGLKSVDLITISTNQCFDTARIKVRVKPMPDPRFAPLKQFYCENEAGISIIPNQSGGQFYGKNIVNQQYVPRILWGDTVTYVITQEGCTDSSKQFTQVYPLPNAFLGNDTSICKHESILLKPTSWNSTFIWGNGSSDTALRVTRAGQYWVTAKNICGTDSDTINISVKDINCRFFLPTAFTPNANGINDRYRPVTFDVDEMVFEIYNRWGGKVYEGDINDLGWDGTYADKNSPEGYYVVVVKYSYQTELRNITETAHEVFYLLR